MKNLHIPILYGGNAFRRPGFVISHSAPTLTPDCEAEHRVLFAAGLLGAFYANRKTRTCGMDDCFFQRVLMLDMANSGKKNSLNYIAVIAKFGVGGNKNTCLFFLFLKMKRGFGSIQSL
jgi:hypothetical protein